jgi:hypothetical protein
MSPTTTDGVVVQGVAISTARLELVNTKCRTCAATVDRLESTAYSHVWHWLTHTPCGHSRLCQRMIICPVCYDEIPKCAHCVLEKCPLCHAALTPTISPPPGQQNAPETILEPTSWAADDWDAASHQAPELLEACELGWKFAGEAYGNGRNPRWTEEMAKDAETIKAAIAKAKGG